RAPKGTAWLQAATNKDLAVALAAGAFRRDLYYRLDVFTIHLPPLGERGEDVPLLAQFFLKRFATKYGKRVSRLGEAAMAAIRDYPWPGNVRELKHVIERAVLGWTGGDEIGNVSLGFPAAGGGALRAPAGPASPFPPLREIPHPAHLVRSAIVGS